MPELSWNAEDFLRMYRSLIDPEEREANQRLEERRQRADMKRQDTGL